MDQDQLEHLVESAHMDRVAQGIIDAGIADVAIPNTFNMRGESVYLSLENALRDLLSANANDAAVALFVARVKRMLGEEIERYAAENAAELEGLSHD